MSIHVYDTLVSEEDATERATKPASASLLAPVTVTCTDNYKPNEYPHSINMFNCIILQPK